MTSKDNNLIFDRSKIFNDWVPKKVVQEFFGYGNTKMSTFATEYNIRVSKVGKRLFYNYTDIMNLISNSIVGSE